MLRDVQLALDERLVDNELCAFVRQAAHLPGLYLLPHRLEVPLHAVHGHCEDINEAHVFGVFCKDGREIA